jgi:hypothetical protein
LCIPAYDIENSKPKVYKTGHHEKYTVDLYRPMYQVALATGAAPTYFSPFKGVYSTFDNNSINVPLTVDGGVFSNNPTLIGILEAHKGLGIKLEDIEVLSIGTGSEVYTESDTKSFFGIPIPRLWGAFYWMNKARILNLMFQAQSQHIDDTCKILSRGTGNYQTSIFPYFRIQTILDENLKTPMDTRDKRKLEALANRAISVFQNNGNKITQMITGTERWGGYSNKKK